MVSAVAATHRPGARLRAVIRDVTQEVRRTQRGHDLWIISAGVTFYALVALVPSLVVAARLRAGVVGPNRLVGLGAAVSRALPAAQGAGDVVQRLVDRSVDVRWTAVAVALIPATVYGEGLRRGFLRVTPESEPPGRFVGWRSRAAALPLTLLAPAGLLGVLEVAPLLARLFGTGGVGPGVLAVYIALNVDWVVVSLALTYIYRVLGPAGTSMRATLGGAFFTGAFISGFLQGFVLFLAIPVDLGAPFGGFTQVGGAVAVALWLWVFTALTVIGYSITLALDTRGDRTG